jgi:hypothetical protein
MRKLWRRPSPAMVVACLALIVALGGTSVAAVSQLVPRNSVGPRQIIAGAVTGPKIRANAISSAKVANRSLLRIDFAQGQLPAGPTGPPGPAGAAGPAGPAGAAGVIGAITVRTASVQVTPGQSGRITRNCEGNERAISAGTSWSHDDTTKLLYTSELRPQLNPQNQVIGFLGWGRNGTGVGQETSTFTVHVLCYTP